MKTKLGKRLRSQRDLEWFNVVLVPGSVSYALSQTDFEFSVGYALALVPLAGLLVIGGYWWHCKLVQFQRGLTVPAGLFRRLQRLSWALLALPLPAILWAWPSLGPRENAVSAAIWVLALLEYVNYFHVQLMHDTRADWHRLVRDRRLRPSGLARDLRRGGQ